jgi:hypothetical protein
MQPRQVYVHPNGECLGDAFLTNVVWRRYVKIRRADRNGAVPFGSWVDMAYFTGDPVPAEQPIYFDYDGELYGD